MAKRSSRLAAGLLAWLLVGLLAWLLLPVTPAAAAPGFSERCEQALPKRDIDALLERTRTATAGTACTLQRVDTDLFRTRITWLRDGVASEALLAPRGCLIEPSFEGPDLAYYAPPSPADACPEGLAALHDFVAGPQEQLVPVLPGQEAEQLEEDRAAPGDSLPMVAALAWLVALVLGLHELRRRRREPQQDPLLRARARRFALAALLLFALALIARWSVVPSLGNWYGPFLPAEGFAARGVELRFGAAPALLQELVRRLSPWTPSTAYALQRLIGALAVPLLMVVVRRLGGSLAASVIAGTLLALAPVAVRLSASSAEHVLAGTLALGVWAVWLRTPTEPGPSPRVLALALMVLAVLSRVDCFPQLILIPLWTLLARPAEDGTLGWAPLRRRLLDAGVFALAWVLLGIYGWFEIVVPSHHPGPPASAVLATLVVLPTQLWTAAFTPPHWISPLTAILAGAGLLTVALERRWGFLLAAVLTWALIFVPLGRNLTHDGLTGARYFVLALPLLALLAGQLGDLLVRVSARLGDGRRRTLAWVASAFVFLLLAVVAAQPGWRHSYTFQAEYRFLAEQLQEHPVDDCTLWFVRPRQNTGEPDLDCCLAPDRSPLTLL
ncbi:MAG: hypothetical protein KDB18_09955, partial [Salinibacterium sp.]|nr:hypothetical protein [Salinibacterium sp.]